LEGGSKGFRTFWNERNLEPRTRLAAEGRDYARVRGKRTSRHHDVHWVSCKTAFPSKHTQCRALKVLGASERRKRRNRYYLTRSALPPNPRVGTAWQILYHSQENKAFICTMGVGVKVLCCRSHGCIGVTRLLRGHSIKICLSRNSHSLAQRTNLATDVILTQNELSGAWKASQHVWPTTAMSILYTP
jgi:hypothetical protein